MALLKKKQSLVFVVIAVIIAILVMLTPPNPLPEPPAWMDKSPEKPKPQAMSGLLENTASALSAAKITPRRPWIEDNQDLLLEEYGDLIDRFTAQSQALSRPPCAPSVDDRRRVFDILGWGEWLDYQNESKLFQLLLLKADRLLQNGDEAGLDYLETAARIPQHFYRNPPVREMIEGTMLFIHLARYMLDKMPPEWFSERMICWFPSESRMRANLHVMLDADMPFFIEQFEKGGLEDIFANDNVKWLPGVFLADFPPVRQANRNHFIHAYHQWSAYFDGPLGEEYAPKFRMPSMMEMLYPDGPAKLYLGNMVSTSGPTTRVGIMDILIDRVRVEIGLAGQSQDPQQILAVIDELGLENIMTGLPYEVDDLGRLIAPVRLGRLPVSLSDNATAGVIFVEKPRTEPDTL